MSGESLTALLRRTKQTLCVPAAEYVPAMGDAMLLLDRAIQMSYQTDPCWLSSSSAAERAVMEELGNLVGLAKMRGGNLHEYGAAIKDAEDALSSVRGEGGDKQATRPCGPTAPTDRLQSKEPSS